MTGRVLCLDPGLRQIGVALSDELGVTAREYGAYANNREFWPTINKICDSEQIKLIVIGRPLQTDGSTTEQTAWTESFAERVRAEIYLPVEMEAETATSKAAEEFNSRKNVDSTKIHATAAKIILEGYLASHR